MIPRDRLWEYRTKHPLRSDPAFRELVAEVERLQAENVSLQQQALEPRFLEFPELDDKEGT